MERLTRTRRKRDRQPVGPDGPIPQGGGRCRFVETQGGDARHQRQDPRRQEHRPYESGPENAADERTDGHAGQLAGVDGGEGPASTLGRDGAGDHGQAGHHGRPFPGPLEGRAGRWRRRR